MADDTTAGDTEGADARGDRVGRASLLLASGTLVSRALGFASAAVLAQTLGTRFAGADTFAIANQLPNNIYAIVAGGLLSAVLVPQIVRAGVHDDGGQKFINRILTLGALVFLAVAALATLCAPLLVGLYAQSAADGGRGLSPAEMGLATAFAYWCLPQILFYALYSLLGEVLNARRVFGPFTWAPVVNNVVAIAGLVAFALLFSSRDVTDATAWTPDMVAVLAGSATAGIAAQAFVLLLFWRRAGLTYRPEFRWRGVGLGRVGRAAGWTFGMILVTQLAGIVQSNVASLSAGSGFASAAALRFSWLIFMLPHGIVAVSIATAYFTRMAGHARDGELDALRADISASLRRIGLLMVLATVGLVVLAFSFASLFSRDGDAETRGMALVLLVFLPGLVPFSVLFVLQRSFYALEDTRTPFLIQCVQAAVMVVGLLAVSAAPTEWIAVGIALVTTVAGFVQAVLAWVLLRRRLDGFGGRRVLRQHALYLLAALPAAGAGVGLDLALGAFDGGFATSGFVPAALTMAAGAVLMTGIYLGALRLLRVGELDELAGPVLARLRRR